MRDKEEMARYKSKSVDWLAEKLYDARHKADVLRERCMQYARDEIREAAADRVYEENEVLAELLQKTGKKLKRLNVRYYRQDCPGCPYFRIGCCESEWPEDDCVYEKIERVVSFYTYEVSDKYGLSGITGDYRRFMIDGCDLLRVEDANTHRVLYEYKEEET